MTDFMKFLKKMKGCFV